MTYKRLIRSKIEAYREQNSNFTFSLLANELKIEPSYLSRFFSSKSIHFSDELLYRMLKRIELKELEIDYLFLLKDMERAQHPDRRRFLLLKVRAHRLSLWKDRLHELKKQLSELGTLVDRIT